jgi:hypothetical protein
LREKDVAGAINAYKQATMLEPEDNANWDRLGDILDYMDAAEVARLNIAPTRIYDEIGVTRVVNASGSMTRLGGSLIAPEVLEAMARAARITVSNPLGVWA